MGETAKFSEKQMRALAGPVAYQISSLSAGWGLVDTVAAAMDESQRARFHEIVKEKVMNPERH